VPATVGVVAPGVNPILFDNPKLDKLISSSLEGTT